MQQDTVLLCASSVRLFAERLNAISWTQSSSKLHLDVLRDLGERLVACYEILVAVRVLRLEQRLDVADGEDKKRFQATTHAAKEVSFQAATHAVSDCAQNDVLCAVTDQGRIMLFMQAGW